MKTKLIYITLIIMVSISLAACGDNAVQSVIDDTDVTETEETTIPEAVLNLSEEDDKALTGVLTEDSYTNEYFGLKINRPEGGSIQSLSDGKGVTDIKPFSQTFKDGYGSIYIGVYNSPDEDADPAVTAGIYATEDEQKGKSEKERVQERIELEQEWAEKLEHESVITMETLNIGGEEHPAFVSVTNEDGTEMKNAIVYLLKNDFECMISIYVPVDDFDHTLALFEKF